MPYKVLGKVYTDSPMLDELVYNGKLILAGLVVKNETLALNYETQETITSAEDLLRCLRGIMTFETFPYTQKMLIEFGYDAVTAFKYVNDISLIPIADRENLLAFCVDYYITHYEEKNKYYRSLLGLPEYNTTEYDIYLDPSWIPSDYTDPIDFTKPLHKQDIEIINILQGSGKIDELIEEKRSFDYSYLRFLGDNKLDINMCRQAKKWDILDIPPVESLVKNRFQELYNKNKEIYLKHVWQSAYEYNSQYYEETLILMLICQTFNDLVVDTPEWYIKRDIFDLRSVQFFLESYGVKYFPEIPLKYQIRIVKNLNKLIRYKSSNRNNYDILEIFGLMDTDIYKYYLFKERKTDGSGHYIEDPDLEKMYDLKFIECKLGDTYDNYIKNESYKHDYEATIYYDPYWNATESPESVKYNILAKDFVIEPSKYMRIRSEIDYSRYIEQMKFFLGLILDSQMDLNDITIGVPYIASGLKFKLSNLFILICAFNDGYAPISTDYNNAPIEPRIRRPEDNEEYTETKPSYDPDINDFWLKRNYPELFVNDNHRVVGFNPLVDIDKIDEIISRGYKNFAEQGSYDFEYFGVENYIVPKKASTIDDLVYIYDTNIECYYNLQKYITYKADNKDVATFAEFLNKELFTRHFDYEFSNGKYDLPEVLKTRDYTLYSFYQKIMSETDQESRNEDILSALNEIIGILEFYLGRENLNYLFSFTPIGSFGSVLKYIQLLINWFKSYKVYFLEPVVIYKMSSPYDNKSSIYDRISERNINVSKYDKHFLNDLMRLCVILEFNDEYRYSMREIVDLHHKFTPIEGDDYDYDGGISTTDITDKEADGADSTDNYPYNMINGRRAYGDAKDKWYLNGGKPDNITAEKMVTGGYICNQDLYRDVSSQFTMKFNNRVHGGYPNTNTFIDHVFFKRIKDVQYEEATHLVAAYTGLLYNNNGTDRYYTEDWRYWRTNNEFLTENNSEFYYLENLYNYNIDVSLENDDYCPSITYISDLGNEDTSYIIYI